MNEWCCNAVLGGSPRVTTEKLQRVMNSAARMVSNTRKFDGGLLRLLHDEFHWLNITDRVQFKLAVLMYRCLHGMAPLYLMNSCTPMADVVVVSICGVPVDRSELSSEQFWSSMFCCCGPIDLEFAARQSLRSSTESQHF